MSNKLKRVGIGVTKHEKNALRHHDNINRIIDEQGRNISHSMSYITFETLYDKFDFGLKKMSNFCDKTIEGGRKWKMNEAGWTSRELLEWSNNKGFGTYQYIKSIPMSSKLKLAQKSSGRHIMGIEKELDSRLLILTIICQKVLTESYRFTKKQIAEFCYWIEYFIDSYARGYLNDQMIVDLFIEELNYDIRKGAKAS